MNQQEIFDKAYLGLKAQGKRAFAYPDRIVCQYMTTDGDRCAIGHLLSQEDATYWETVGGQGCSLSAAMNKNFPGVQDWMEEHYMFLSELQAVHDYINDDWDHPELGFESKFRRFAEKHKLTIPEVEYGTY